MRVAAIDADVAGRQVPAGAIVHVHRAQADRDPLRFADPQRLDLRRGRGPGSLALGAGAHYCLGASLVRMIADVALFTVLPRVASLTPTSRTPQDWDFADELWLCMRHDGTRRSE